LSGGFSDNNQIAYYGIERLWVFGKLFEADSFGISFNAFDGFDYVPQAESPFPAPR
jgi:hypothetical protein